MRLQKDTFWTALGRTEGVSLRNDPVVSSFPYASPNLVLISLLHCKSIFSIRITLWTLSWEGLCKQLESVTMCLKLSKMLIKPPLWVSNSRGIFIATERCARFHGRSACCDMIGMFADSWVLHSTQFCGEGLHIFISCCDELTRLRRFILRDLSSFRLRVFSSCVVPSRKARSMIHFGSLSHRSPGTSILPSSMIFFFFFISALNSKNLFRTVPLLSTSP